MRAAGARPTAPFKHDPTVAALLTLDDGTPVAYEGTWAEPLARDVVERRLGARRLPGPRDLVGGRRRCPARDGAVRPASRALRGGSRLPSLRAIDRLGVLAELRRALAAGEQPECSAADNLRSLAVVFALARSTEERRPVASTEVLAS